MKQLQNIKQTFALQLVVFLFIFTMLIFLLMFFSNSFMTRSIMVKNAELTARDLTAANINKIEGILSNIENLSDNTAFLIGTDRLNEPDQAGFFQNQMVHNGEILAITVAYSPEYLERDRNTNSITYCLSSTDFVQTDIGESVRQYVIEDWFIIPTSKKSVYWSEPWIDKRISNQPITSFSTPIYKNSDLVGIIRTDVSILVLQRIVSSMRLLKTGYAILLTGNGTFVTHPADSLILNYSIFSYAQQLNNDELSAVGKEMIKGKTGFEKLVHSESYPSRWIYFAPIRLNNWSVGVQFSEKELMSDLNKVELIFSLILGIGLLLLLTSIYTRVTTIFRPLSQLVKATNKIGSGDFNVQLPQTYMKNEVSLLTESFSKMQSELKLYLENLMRTTHDKDKIAAEIKFAAQVQQKIIPTNQNLLTQIKEVSIYGILEPAEDIGGDFYDAFMIDDSIICIVIADVFGKGIVASMLMTMVQTLIRSQSRYSSSAIKLVREVNSYLCENNKQSNFITLIVGILNLQTGSIEFCNAGHTPIFLKKPGQSSIKYSETHSTALGIFEDLKIGSSTFQLDAQDILIFFTDGISEAMNEQETFFGFERIEQIISDMQNPTPEGIAKAIFKEVRSFTGKAIQGDDLSILVLKFNHPRK